MEKRSKFPQPRKRPGRDNLAKALLTEASRRTLPFGGNANPESPVDGSLFAEGGNMHDRHRSRSMFQNNERVRLALLSPLIICALGIVFTVQAQDSAKPQAPDSREVSGFLGDYSALVPDAKNGDLLLYEKDPSVLSKYNKFILDPVTIYLLPAAAARGIDPDDLERLAQNFQKAVSDELTKSGRYQIVTTPGPGVLELNVAITNVEPTGGGKNAAVKGAATAATIGAAPGASLLVPRISVGKIAIEGEMLDSTSGERMVAFVTSKGGRRWFSGLKTFQKWGDIEAAFRYWAKDFRERLDEAHGS
jgi:hypothetical protein